MTIQIAVLNSSTSAKDADVQHMIPALQTQWNRDLAPAWSIDDVVLTFYPAGKKPPAKTWWLVFLDNADVSNALAYHDLTSDGFPISKVFVETVLGDGASLSVSASHELVEMAVDPYCNLAAQGLSGAMYAYETADPVEDDGLGYLIGDVLVSDFVLPSWFQVKGGKKPFDFKAHCKRAYQILKGGYAQTFENGDWQQLSREPTKFKALHAPVGSRRERRKRLADWKLSAPEDRADHALGHDEAWRQAIAENAARSIVAAEPVIVAVVSTQEHQG